LGGKRTSEKGIAGLGGGTPSIAVVRRKIGTQLRKSTPLVLKKKGPSFQGGNGEKAMPQRNFKRQPQSAGCTSENKGCQGGL